jgi:chemotaxis family two-component system response regulator PixG
VVKSVKETTPFTSLNLFTASKQIRFLEKLKQLRFSGELVLTEPKGQLWRFYFYLGSIIYATGGVHPVRRWRRNLAKYCPQMPAHRSALQQDVAAIENAAFISCWEYQLLCLWVAQQKISSERAAQMIRGVISEVLFDVGQALHVTSQIKQDNSLFTPLVSIDVQQAIAEVHQHWQVWRDARVATCSPNSAPLVKQPEGLRARTSPQVYRNLSKVLSGRNTLRDLALLMKRDVAEVTRSLLLYIQLGLVELISIPDLPAPVDTPVAQTPATPPKPKGPLVACVDDSPLVCQTMEALLTAAGYQFVGVEDAMRAFSILLARKPDVIFLDLVMPNTNGYEICSQLRKVSCFRNTPIVILTGNDGIVDRVRAKLVGASDFLSKPVDAGLVLSVIRKHIEQGAQGLKVEG